MNFVDRPRGWRPDMLPIAIEVTQVWVVWVDDDEEAGAERVMESLRLSGTAYEYIEPGTYPEGSDMVIRAPAAYELPQPLHGPWNICAAPGCQNRQYPAYGHPHCSAHYDRPIESAHDSVRGRALANRSRTLPAHP